MNMKIISFGAIFLNNAQVNKKAPNNTYQKANASFVEMNPKDSKDMKALENIQKYWEYEMYASNIYNMALKVRKDELSPKKYKIYTLTSQTSDFNKMDDRKILGAVQGETLKKDFLYIDYLQVNPQYIYFPNADYKRNGSAILDSLKEHFSEIMLKPNKGSTEKFYEKNGFHKVGDLMFWSRNNNEPKLVELA